MFDAVRNNKRIVQIFLALIALPFAFFGVDAYLNNAGLSNSVASVGKTKISQFEFDRALQIQGAQLQQRLGQAFSPEFLELPEFKRAVLNALIDERLVALEAKDNKIFASQTIVKDIIRNTPAFQENGKFSKAQYERVLASSGSSMNPDQYERLIAQDLEKQQLQAPIAGAGFASAFQTDLVFRLQTEERVFSEKKVLAAAFADKLSLNEDDFKKYYETHAKTFETPKRIKAEFLVLSLEELMAETKVSEAEIQKFYDDNRQRFDASERRASHILLVSEKEDAKVHEKAEALLKEARANPDKFAELAKAHSQDPASAEQGGDLGFFPYSGMVEPFAKAAFATKEGQIADLVKSDFGYHIIKVTGIKAGKVTPLSEAAKEITLELKRRLALEKMPELSQALDVTVFEEETESLKPAAAKYNLKRKETDWFSQTPDPQTAFNITPLNHPKLLKALFESEAVTKKHNLKLIEISPNVFVAARVTDFAPAAVPPFEALKAKIEKQMRDEALTKEAKTAGEALVTRLNTGEDKEAWSATKTISRSRGAQGVSAQLLRLIFGLNSQKLPAYAGHTNDAGDYVIYKLTKVAQPERKPEEIEQMKKALNAQYASILSQEDWQAYLTILRARHKIKINEDALRPRAPSGDAG